MSSSASVIGRKIVRFYKPTETHGELSNYFPLTKPIIYCGKAYPTSEHLYHALKFTYTAASKDSRAYAERIRVVKSPNMAKILAHQKVAGGYPWRTTLNREIEASLARGVSPRNDWEAVKVARMHLVLQLKFSTDPVCQKVLLATGDTLLIEHTVNDAFWGNGGRDDIGQNMLGKLLMQIRAEVQTLVADRPEQTAKRRIISIGSLGFVCHSTALCAHLEKNESAKK
jgi:ribA/ribD-fused uncharacterized protein